MKNAVESGYFPLAWEHEQSKYFPQGCSHLTMVTNNKPLTKLFGDRTLDKVTTHISWSFETMYDPGKTNLAADDTPHHYTMMLHRCDLKTSKSYTTECHYWQQPLLERICFERTGILLCQK